MPLDDFAQKIVALNDFDIAKETCDIINEESEFIQDLLKKQLSEGIDGDGNPKTLIRKGGTFPFYAKSTVNKKLEYGIGYGGYVDRITHQMTGEFYHEIKVHAAGEEFVFDSSVEYFDDIISHSGSGSKIMELTQENLELFANNVLVPQLQERFNLLFNGL